MKINSTFQVSVFLMAVLMFSMPFITFAEAGSVAAEAKAAAIADVENDVSIPLWFLAGCAIPGGSVVGTTTGAAIGFAADPIEVSYPECLTGGSFILPGMCLGFIIGGLLPYILVTKQASLSTPPVEQLVGKPPVYVEVYTDVYQRKMRQHRGRWAILGTVTGYAILGVYANASR